MLKKRLRQVKKTLKNERGSGYIEAIVHVMIIAFCLALTVGLIGLGAAYAKVQSFTSAAADIAAASGTVNSDDINTLMQKSGLDTDKLSMTWDADYYDKDSGKLAFRKEFDVRVTYSYSLLKAVNIPVTYKAAGMSGVFWK